MIFFILLFIFISIPVLIFFYCWYRLYTSLHIHVSENKENVSKYMLPYEVRYFKTKDNVKIASWYLRSKNPKAIVILLHGYKTEDGGKALMLGHANYLYKNGYASLLIDFRSVGESFGNKVMLGVKEWMDAEAAYDYMRSLSENKNVKIGFLGISLGASAAINCVGLTHKGDFIIASVPAASYTNFFAAQIKNEKLPLFLFLPILKLAACFILGFSYQTYDAIKQITGITVPLFLIKAKHDKVVFPQDTNLLYEKANNPKRIWEADSQHDVFSENQKMFGEKVLLFLKDISFIGGFL